MSIAWELGRRCRDARTLLVTEHASPMSASAAAGVMLSGFAETTVLTHAAPAGTAKAKLRLDAAREWPAWATAINNLDNLEKIALENGTVVILNAVGGDLDERNFRAILSDLDAAGESYENVDPSDLQLRCAPHARPLRAVRIPREQWVESASTLRALSNALTRLPSVEVVHAAPATISGCAPDGKCTLTVGDARVEASETLLAAGYRTTDLLEFDPELRAAIPRVLAGSGAALICHTPTPRAMPTLAVRTPNRAFACGLHALSWSQPGLCYVGATNNVQRNVGTSPLVGDIGFLIDCATEQIDCRLAGACVSATRLGARPVTEDSFPLLGQTSRRGLWLATGTFRDGFLCAPVIATRLVDALLAQRPQLADLEAFAPCRRPISPCTVEEAIANAVENYLAIAFERGARLPAVGGWVEDFRGTVEARVRAIYRSATAKHTIPPDFLWDVEKGDIGSVFGVKR